MPGGLDPKKLQSMMKQMGIKNNTLDAKRVIIELEDKKLVIENPNVTEVDMQGQKTYQVMGEAKEEQKELEIPKEDIDMVSENTQKDQEQAKKALKESNGDIAQAIEKLKEE